MLRSVLMLSLALTLGMPPRVSAESFSCGSFPSLDDAVPKEERVDMLLKRAGECVHERKFVEAIALVSELIGIDPQNPNAYIDRGSAYIRTGRFDLVIADYSHAITLKSDDADAWYNRGTAFVSAQQFDNGLTDLNEAIRLRPGFAPAYCNRPAAYMEKNDLTRRSRISLRASRGTPIIRFAITSAVSCTCAPATIKRRCWILRRRLS